MPLARPDSRTSPPAGASTPSLVWASLMLSVFLFLLFPMAGEALVFASESSEPIETIPPDFPYWDHVTQRRYEGPTVILLGGGWALTARHVGTGEVMLHGEVIPMVLDSQHTLLNRVGSPADAMIFALESTPELLELPMLPIAREPPQIGEEVLMIGFGRLRDKSIEWGDPENPLPGFTWTEFGEKRWGTNRIDDVRRRIRHKRFETLSMTMRFDAPDEPNATPHEASASVGDSGGALFVNRNGEWQLAGLITSISRPNDTPNQLTTIGDVTYAADLSNYRWEILRWARPSCGNEEDDDQDGKIDYPYDLDCESPLDDSERPDEGSKPVAAWAVLSAFVVSAFGGVVVVRRRRRRRLQDEDATSTPDSTSPSSAP